MAAALALGGAQERATPPIDVAAWVASGYRPTPTIIEAAEALYQTHSVDEIARSDAGAKNLQATATRIANIIETSKSTGRKSICFITGVPGAGKTLAGLNIAAKRATAYEDEHAVFLSGNGPLVDVLREALARDQGKREGVKKSDALRSVRRFVQNIHHFRDHYLGTPDAPFEKVVVFDEAQRAWDSSNTLTAAQCGNALLASETGRDNPDLLLGRILFARLSLDTPDQLVSGVLRCSGCLGHLRSIMASMNQKSSVAQTPKFVR